MKTILVSIVVFGIIIFVHELGHYWAARRSGIKVLELALGLGPRILGWTRNGTDYTLRAIPFGGFCRMLGLEDPEEKGPGNFLEKPLLSRIMVVAAGSLMNFALAIILLFCIFFFFIGVTDQDSTLVGNVIPDMPASEAGLQSGDEIISIDGIEVAKWQEIITLIENRGGRSLDLLFSRDGQRMTVALTPVERDYGEFTRHLIGIEPRIVRYSVTGSLSMSFGYLHLIGMALYQTVIGEIPLDVMGPVGIVDTVGQAASVGFVEVMLLTALISLSLGIMNLLPIPALDGGRLVFLFLEGIRGRPLDPQKEGFIHMIGFAFLLILIILVTFNDLSRLDIIR